MYVFFSFEFCLFVRLIVVVAAAVIIIHHERELRETTEENDDKKCENSSYRLEREWDIVLNQYWKRSAKKSWLFKVPNWKMNARCLNRRTDKTVSSEFSLCLSSNMTAHIKNERISYWLYACVCDKQAMS